MRHTATLIALAALLALPLPARAQDERPQAAPQEPESGSVVERLRERFETEPIMRVYAFGRHQERALERIAIEWPDLKERAQDLQLAWNSKFSDSFWGVETLLRERVGDWEDFVERIDQGLTNRLNQELTDKASAEHRLETIDAYLDYRIPSPFFEYMLALDPRYTREPAAEYEENLAKVVSTDGTGGAHGLKIELHTPRSWLPVPARGGPPIQMRSDAARGLETVAVAVFPPAEDQPTPDAERLRELTSEAHLDKTNADAEFVESGETTIAGRPAAWVRFRDAQSGHRGYIKAITWAAYIALDEHIVKIEATIADSGDDPSELLPYGALERQWTRFQPVLDVMLERLTIERAER